MMSDGKGDKERLGNNEQETKMKIKQRDIQKGERQGPSETKSGNLPSNNDSP